MRTSQQWREWLCSLGGTPVVYREDVEELVADMEALERQVELWENQAKYLENEASKQGRLADVLQRTVEEVVATNVKHRAVIEGIKAQLGRL